MFLSETGAVIGFLIIISSQNQRKGILARPMIHDEYLDHLPKILAEVASWLAQLGKTSIQIVIPDERPLLLEAIKELGWTLTHAWVQLVKYL